MAQMEQRLVKGAVNGDLSTSLDDLRRDILCDGITSNNDGMVRYLPPTTQTV